jgi:hypothetical protein
MRSEIDRVRIVVEIDRAEPFRGTIAEPEQPLRTFDGWTAFAAAIAAVVRRFDSQSASRPGGRGAGPEG